MQSIPPWGSVGRQVVKINKHLGLTETRAELLALNSNLPLATCFTHGHVFMSLLLSEFIPPSLPYWVHMSIFYRPRGEGGDVGGERELQRGGDVCTHMCCAKLLSHVRLFATPWTLAGQAPLSMGFSRQEYWSGLPFPPP